MYGILYLLLISSPLTCHLLYELMYTLATWRRVQLLCTEAAHCHCILYFTCMEAFSGMCFMQFIWFFPQRFFGEVFFPWACWPHVLNKSVFMLAHPSYLNVCFCVVHLVVFIFALLCTDSRFLHVAQSSLVPRPRAFVACSTKFSANFVLQARNAQGLGTRLAQSPRFLHVQRCPIPFIKMQWIVC